MDFRIEHDTMGTVSVPADALWGAQTQRSLSHFAIGQETMPPALISALVLIKRACAHANFSLGRLDARQESLITQVCDEILSGKHADAFPLSVWQTGSGTQTNMNVNEVIARRGNLIAGEQVLHPNDHVNLSQSSNDTFPSAMHIAAACELHTRLLPELLEMQRVLQHLERAHEDVLKIGRTHLQDAVPMRFSQEISAWRCMLSESQAMIESSGEKLFPLALGATAIGTGLNAPVGFADAAIAEIAAALQLPFSCAQNKFHALSSKDALVFSHGALRTLATNLLKLANDVRWLASGPRCGLSEIRIPENEPGSSIMPGKVNPTQCEALSMVAVQVMANDMAVSMAGSQGNFQLNVYMPMMSYNYLQSVQLLSDAMCAFRTHCLSGLEANREQMAHNVEQSLMTVTALTPHVGYENGAKIAKLAFSENISLKEAVQRLSLLTGEEFDRVFHPEDMV